MDVKSAIPFLPERPRVHPVAVQLVRSYPTGHQLYSRGRQGQPLLLSISTPDPLPSGAAARLITTINTTPPALRSTVAFEKDGSTFKCWITPQTAGLHTFRAEFSLDNGRTWQRDTVPDALMLIDPPQVDALRLYIVIPTVAGTITDWKADLPRIAALGFNAIHLLPVTAMDLSQSPYAAEKLFDVDASYVDPAIPGDGMAQLRDYVAAAKSLGIRLCFDLVLNHVGTTSDIARRAPDWIVPDPNEPDGLARAGFWSHHGWQKWDDIVQINYDHPSDAIRSEIWDYMTRYALHWAELANTTGGFVRFDNLHGGCSEFIEAVTTALHQAYPELGILAEYFADERTLLKTVPQWQLNLVLATPWSQAFVPQLRDFLKYLQQEAAHIRYFMPITSHDSGSPAQEFSTADATVPRYVAAALLGTGATGMPMGVEYGLKERLRFIGRQPKAVFTDPPRFGPFITAVNRILADHPAFRDGSCRFVDDNHQAIIAAIRSDTAGNTFLVVCNFDVVGTQTITLRLDPLIPPNSTITSTDLLGTGQPIHLQPTLNLTLAPCQARVIRLAVNL